MPQRNCYAREVCKIMRESTDVNIEQLRAGMAWWYREYAGSNPLRIEPPTPLSTGSPYEAYGAMGR